MAILGHNICKELTDALGLPKQTVGFTLRCYFGELVSVECEYYPEGSFVSALAEYDLVRRPVQSVEALVNFDEWMRERTEIRHRNFMLASSLNPARFE